jgi:hypothetical protein
MEKNGEGFSLEEFRERSQEVIGQARAEVDAISNLKQLPGVSSVTIGVNKTGSTSFFIKFFDPEGRCHKLSHRKNFSPIFGLFPLGQPAH